MKERKLSNRNEDQQMKTWLVFCKLCFFLNTHTHTDFSENFPQIHHIPLSILGFFTFEKAFP